MKTALLAVILIASITGVAFGSPESELKALEQQWIDAYAKGDTAFLKTIEADDWMFIGSDGAVSTKAQDIKDLEDKNFVLKSSSISEIKVTLLGDNHAYVTTLWDMASGTYKGTDMSGQYRTLDIFEKKNNKWQAKYSQLTKVKK